MYLVRNQLRFDFSDGQVTLGLAIVLIISGAIPGLSGVVAFIQHKTTANPHKPDNASKLVITGVYQFSRNPMYLGLLLWLVGWGVYLSSFTSMLFLPLFVLYMNQYQIIPEEKVLTELFGNDYKNYQQRVRRWL